MVSIEGSEFVKRVEKEAACRKFVACFEKMGWSLKSKLQMWRQRPAAYDATRGVLLFDKEEWMVRGIFAIDKIEPVRIELPPTSVRKRKDQATTLQEVLKGEGMEAHNPRVRGEHTTVAPI